MLSHAYTLEMKWLVLEHVIKHSSLGLNARFDENSIATFKGNKHTVYLLGPYTRRTQKSCTILHVKAILYC